MSVAFIIHNFDVSDFKQMTVLPLPELFSNNSKALT